MRRAVHQLLDGPMVSDDPFAFRTISPTTARTIQARGNRKVPPALAHKAGLHVKETSLSSFLPLKALQGWIGKQGNQISSMNISNGNK
jgi:hypothetical protein